MITFLITHIGQLVQLYVLYSIHAAVFYEITAVEEYLLMNSTYDRDFNHLTGWPLYVLTIFYYYKSCTKHPGPVRKDWDSYCKDDRFAVRTCNFCKVSKPYRTSHCRRCKKCVARRDHHCVFTNNCIGYGNHKAFLWFLVFGFMGSLHFIYRGGTWVYEWYYGDMLSDYSTCYAVLLGIHVYNMMGFAGLLGHLSFKTLKNIHCNALTMDSWTQKTCFGDSVLNGFDLGIVKNWTLLLGEEPLLWLSTRPPEKFGVSIGPEFPHKPEYLA